MSILDDAIREHLELKRQHGAPDDEVKKLEDEAFGPPARPDDSVDPMAEAPTEFMMTPESEATVASEAAAGESEGRRTPDIADLQEAPPAPEEAAPEEEELEALTEPDAPAEEEQPAMEHEVIAEPPTALPEDLDDSAASHTTQERHAIAEQPTEMFDVERELTADAEQAAPDSDVNEPPAAAEPAPTDEELLASELEEPRLPVEPTPPPAAPAPAFDEEDDFFDEQRLSDELDQALEAPAPAAEPTEEQPLAAFPPTEEAEAVELEEDEPISEEQEQPSEERAFFDNDAEAEEESSAEHEVVPEPAREQGHEDVLEETPDFLEEAPEDDQLWFEQKSPKDFDFGD
jgi:hypothetical protein